MDLRDRIRDLGSSLTRSERRVAEVVLARPEVIAFGTVAELSAASQVGAATVVRLAAKQTLCRGFAVGRSLFAEAADAWFAGILDDKGVIDEVACRYQRLISLWCDAHGDVQRETS